MNLGAIGDYGLALAGIVAGFGALGWAVKKTRQVFRWANRLTRTIDALNDLAQYELNHNGGGSIKDHAAKVPALVEKVDAIDGRLTEHLGTSEAALLAGHKEGERMWSAIEALAKAQPPEEDDT
jgi:hypothetical protein